MSAADVGEVATVRRGRAEYPERTRVLVDPAAQVGPWHNVQLVTVRASAPQCADQSVLGKHLKIT